jgi:hypothetical protein
MCSNWPPFIWRNRRARFIKFSLASLNLYTDLLLLFSYKHLAFFKSQDNLLNRGRLDSWDRRILTLLFIVTSGFTLIEVGLDSLIWLERWVCWFDWNTGFAALTGTLGSLTTLHWFFYPARRTIFCGVFDTLDCISIYIRLQQMYKDGVSRPFVSSCYMFCSYLSTCYLFWFWVWSVLG